MAMDWGTSPERVARGSTYMDEHYPGWERKVDVSLLDIANADQCICGQVCDFTLVVDAFDVIHGDEAAERLMDHGFLASADGDAWVDLIKMRFDTGALSDIS